jgi:hypothetical protein
MVAFRRAPARRRRRSASPALRTPRESPSATIITGASQCRREPAWSASGTSVAPSFQAATEARLQHVAVDLEDAAVARLDRDVALDVERCRHRRQLEVAPLGHGLPVLAFALRRFPRLAAIALDERADDRLRRRQAGGDAALGLAQPPLALGDDSAHRLQGDDEGDDDAREGERFAEKGEAPDCHGVPFSTGCAATCDVTRTIAPGSEENAKATRPGDPGP